MKELLRKYKNNTLSPEQTEELEQKLLKNAVEQEQRQKWGALLQEAGISRTETAKPAPLTAQKGGKFNFIRYAIGAAAAVLIAFGLWQTVVQSARSPVALAEEFIQTENFAAPQKRMSSAGDLATWESAKEAYASKKFELAIENIQRIPNASSEQKFYLGLSLLYQKIPNYDQAFTVFQEVYGTEQGAFKTESQWFAALAATKLGKYDAAKALLKELEGSSWQRENIVKLSKALEKAQK
jgi:hypothetical protein